VVKDYSWLYYTVNTVKSKHAIHACKSDPPGTEERRWPVSRAVPVLWQNLHGTS
jgi:hypothetical protein